MKRYLDCLEDIEGSLYFGYPDNIKYKLLDRQAKCFQALGRGRPTQKLAMIGEKKVQSIKYVMFRLIPIDIMC